MKLEMLLLSEEGEKLYDLNEKAPVENKYWYVGDLYLDPFDFSCCHASEPFNGRPTSKMYLKSCDAYTIVQSAESLYEAVQKEKSKSVFKVN